MKPIGRVIGTDYLGRTWVRTADGHDLPLKPPRKKLSLVRRLRLQRTAGMVLSFLLVLTLVAGWSL